MSLVAAVLVISMWRIEPMPPVRLSASRTPNHVKVFTPERLARAAQVTSNALTMPVLREPRPFTAPSHVPARAAVIWDDAPPANFAQNKIDTTDGVYANPPGVCIGCSGANLSLPAAPPRPAPAPKPVARATAPVRVGGDVRPPVVVHAPRPQYPDLARKARVSGLVRLSSIIGTDGKIRALELVTGHPLLVNAAMDAVRQWTYQPTLLNGEPVEVILMIDVNFSLAQ